MSNDIATIKLKGTSINSFFGRITALRGTRNLTVYPILSQFLRSVRLVLHPKLCIYRSALKLMPPLALLCVACLGFSSSALAESADRDKPIDLEADSLNVDDAKQISTYLGNVILTKGTIVIHADKLIVRDNPAGFQSTSLGNPTTFKQKLEGKNEYMQGSAQRIEYDDRLDKVQLYTKAWVKRGEDIVHGDYISYDANSEYAEVIGGTQSNNGVVSSGRVHAVIQPKNKKVPAPVIENSKPNNTPNNTTGNVPANNPAPTKDSRFSRSLGIATDQKQ